jgi:preprotein translocase subunit YajC
MGKMILAATTAKSSGGSYFFLIVIVAVLALMYFVTVRPQRNRQRQVMQTQRELVPGQQVRTTAGIYGTLTSVSDTDVTLEVAPGVEMRLMRRAVMEVIPPDTPSEPSVAGHNAASDGAGSFAESGSFGESSSFAAEDSQNSAEKGQPTGG